MTYMSSLKTAKGEIRCNGLALPRELRLGAIRCGV